MRKTTNVAVVGAGVIGLSTTVNIQNNFGDKCQVTIIADKFFEETTSYGAAGIFKPPLERMPGVSEAIGRTWIKDSWNHFSTLALDSQADESGVLITSGYMFFNDQKKRPAYADYIYEFHECSAKELTIYPQLNYKYGWHLTTVIVECRKYLPYLMHKFKDRGGKVIKRRLSGFNEIAQEYDIIVNCAAQGNNELLKDDNMFSVRGHLIRVEAPWLKRFVHTDNQYHVYPVRDGVVIGGVRQDNDTDPYPRREDRELILNKAYQMVPSLKDAKIIEEWVGFRPCRSLIRLEMEKKTYQHKARPVTIIHNYGHGPLGVAISWGTAVSVCKLLKEILSSDEIKAKL